MSVVQRSVGGVVWGDFDAEALSALSPLEASQIAANLFAGLKRANIASEPTVSQPFGGPQEAVWQTYYALRARGNSQTPAVEFVPVEESEKPSRPRRRVLRPRRK